MVAYLEKAKRLIETFPITLIEVILKNKECKHRGIDKTGSNKGLGIARCSLCRVLGWTQYKATIRNNGADVRTIMDGSHHRLSKERSCPRRRQKLASYGWKQLATCFMMTNYTEEATRYHFQNAYSPQRQRTSCGKSTRAHVETMLGGNPWRSKPSGRVIIGQPWRWTAWSTPENVTNANGFQQCQKPIQKSSFQWPVHVRSPFKGLI